MLSIASIQTTAFAGSALGASKVFSMTATVQPETPMPEPEPIAAIKTIRVGDKQLAGDMGFDPLSIADTPESLAWCREAEVKHARLAMLAAFGWPVSEITNFGNLLNADGRAPSILNGGLDNVNGLYWAGVVALAVYWEGQGLDKQFGKKMDYLPGVLGFDPLGADSPSMRNAEITNGRVAMIAITAYALEEAVTKAPIFPISLFVTPAPVEAVVKAVASAAPVDVLADMAAAMPAPIAEVVTPIVEAVAEAPVAEMAEAAAPIVDAVMP